MPRPGYVTKVGSTAELPEERADVILVSEPEIGATLRTKGRFYFLCEVAPPSRSGNEIGREVAELARHEYYYDLSAGVEVSLRRALRSANRRAARQLRDQRGRVTLHAACAVLVNNEVYAARIGTAQVFLVRHARLFLPGDEPGELADFVHRTTTRQAPSMGSEADLLPAVWRQIVEAGDTLIIASGGVVEGLGAEVLKNAAVTLHPRSAAEHVRDRFVAEGVRGSDAVIFVEIAPSSGAAARLAPAPEPVREPDEVAIAETIRSRVGAVWRLWPGVGRVAGSVAQPLTAATAKGVAVALELMPRRRLRLPRVPETARARFARQQRLTTLLAVTLLLATFGIGALVVRDYQANRVAGDYALAIVGVENDIASARRLADRRPPDPDGAQERLLTAERSLEEAARSPVADEARIATLRAEIAALRDRLASVLIDLAREAAGAAPASLTQTVHGLYAADPGSGRLWRIFDEPVRAAPVIESGAADGIGPPVLVAAMEEALFTIDDRGRLWKAEGDQVIDITPPGAEEWGTPVSMAVFVGNVYVLDAASGQVWKHEPRADGTFGPAIAFLAVALPEGTARSVSVDGDIWVVNVTGEILRYRRSGIETQAARVNFTVTWREEPVRATHLQAIDSQRFIWALDARTGLVVQIARDGREIARFRVPQALPEPAAFFVSEGQGLAYTAHGSRIATTDLSR
ncbi:MAG TPA: hypothetical protein VMJ92_01280 [Candidatus Limnocylindrales bacterium]|nr:hypothetical protein [Candidatus Limnocylindrales bacterium]